MGEDDNRSQGRSSLGDTSAHLRKASKTVFAQDGEEAVSSENGTEAESRKQVISQCAPVAQGIEHRIPNSD